MKRKGTRLLLTLCAGIFLAAANAVEFEASDMIQPSDANPRYWQYKGKPVVLLGGSREDNLFQIPDIEAHLDKLAKVGGNYIRNTMSSRDEGDLWPFTKRGDGKYDLSTPRSAYYERLDQCLILAYERGIIVQIEVWDRFDYARDVWERNPYRPVNNTTYTVESSGLKNHYPNHPGSNENPFFYTVPELRDNGLVLRYQQAHVDRVLAVTLNYPNVLYCMDNETSGAEEWGAYWAAYIKTKARSAGVRVQVTEMWDDWKLQSPTHRRTFDHPERYDFADVSQNNHQKGQAHWDNLQWALQYVEASPRPLNMVKVYGVDGGAFGNTRDGLERFWRGLFGGAASVRFHRPGGGIGLNEEAQAHLKSARMLCGEYDFTQAAPDAESKRFANRHDNEAYLSFSAPGPCIVYFPNGGLVDLTLRNDMADGRITWLDIANAKWSEAVTFDDGPRITLSSPGQGHWVALIVGE